MKEKIKTITIKIAEIVVVIWAIYGMWSAISLRVGKELFISENTRKIYFLSIGEGANMFLSLIFFYFFSSVLIIYILRRLEK